MNGLKQYKQLVYNIIGSSMRVHSELGYGLLESVYQEALAMELASRGVNCEREKELEIFYRGTMMEKKYRLDIVVGDIICELKSVRELRPEHRAQLCNYLRLTHKPIGLLINFGSKDLIGERWAYDEDTNECYLIDVNMERIYCDNEDEDDDENEY